MATVQDLRGTAPATTTWQIEPSTSRVEFTVRKRLMLVKKLTVTGRFADVSGTISVDEQSSANTHVAVTIGTGSVDTKLPRRDKHLRTADFFDIARFPSMTFTSSRVEVVDRAQGRYRVTGELTVRGTSRQVTLDAQYLPGEDPSQPDRAHFMASTELNRRDFGMVWNKTLIHVWDDVRVTLDIRAVRS